MISDTIKCYDCLEFLPQIDSNLKSVQEDKNGIIFKISKIVVTCSNGHKKEVSILDLEENS